MKGGHINNKMSWFGTNKKNEDEKEEEEEDDDEEEDDEDNTYNIDYECKNCLCDDNFDIPKGTTVVNYLKDKMCEECGCHVVDEKIK